MTIRDQLASFVRTVIPYLVTYILVMLGRKFDIVIDDGTSANVVAGLTTLAGTAYYTLVRLLEARWPRLGVLLGLPVQPSYSPTADKL
jgi:hypothetical protein